MSGRTDFFLQVIQLSEPKFLSPWLDVVMPLQGLDVRMRLE